MYGTRVRATHNKPTQLKEVCENDLLLDQIELHKDFYGFLKHLRKTAADADLWAATNRTGKDTKSSDKASTGGSSRELFKWVSLRL
jgi:hypothetical protein